MYLLYIDENGRISILNKTGGRILELCDGQHSIEDIAKILSSEFTGTSYKECLENVKRFIDELRRRGIIEIT